MTTNFTPSTQILEAGEKAQTLADVGKPLKPFLPQEAQQAVEGVDKVAKAFTATGRVLEHFGFDEAEPEVTTSMVELIPTGTSTDVPFAGTPWVLLPFPHLLPTLPVEWSEQFNSQPTDELVPDNLKPSTGVIAAGETLQTIGLNGPGAALQAAGEIMRSFGFDEAELIDTFPIEGIGQGFNGSVIEPFSQSILESFGISHVTPLLSIDTDLSLALA